MRELTVAWPENADQRTDCTNAYIGTMRRPVCQDGAGENPREILESRRDALQRLFTPVGFARTRSTARPIFRSCGRCYENGAFPHRWRGTEEARLFVRVPGCPNATPVKRNRSPSEMVARDGFVSEYSLK